MNGVELGIAMPHYYLLLFNVMQSKCYYTNKKNPKYHYRSKHIEIKFHLYTW
jgi:hypothetical protein